MEILVKIRLCASKIYYGTEQYLTQVHDNTLMNFLPQVSSENLNQ